jgi:SAM-dependent methyltransferase
MGNRADAAVPTPPSKESGVDSLTDGYGLRLFEQLNDEYSDKRVVPEPPKLDPISYRERGEKRLTGILRQTKVDLNGKTVLELGCGHGWLTSLIPVMTGAGRVIGVDIKPRPTWDQHQGVELVCGDLSSEELIPPGSVDFILSAAVMEHVSRPLQMLDALYRLLKPGGTAWLYFNLHRGRLASHKYRAVFFPWPHLLFEDAVCAAFYEKHQGQALEFAWVNRLTLGEYFAACAEIGFNVRRYRLHTAPIDIDFYRRFEEKLGRYPALDLETDFCTLILERREGGVPKLPYVERQRALDAVLSSVCRSCD